MDTDWHEQPKSLTGTDIARRWWRTRKTMMVAALLVGIPGTLLVANREPRYTSTALLVLERSPLDVISQKSNTAESKVDTEVEMLRAISIVELVAARLQLVSKTDSARTGSSAAEISGDAVHVKEVAPEASGDSERAAPTDQPKRMEGEPSSINGKLITAAPLTSAELLEFERRFRITRRGMTDVVAIEATGESPERAAMLANLYADVYLNEQVAAKLSSAQLLEKALEDRIQVLKSEPAEVGAQLQQRQLLSDYLSRLNDIRRNKSLITSDMRLASQALPLAIEAFPSRKLLVLFVWLFACVFAVGVGLFQVRYDIMSRL